MGNVVGFSVGKRVGNGEGITVGFAELGVLDEGAEEEGTSLGADEGNTVGYLVGHSVGYLVGILLGSLDGRRVNTNIGTCVVGVSVG